MPDRLDNFLQFRIADLSVDPAAQPWLGRAIVLTEPDGTRQDRSGRRVPRARLGPTAGSRSAIASSPSTGGRASRREVVRALFDWAHAQGVDRFRASVSPGNVPSLAIIGRFGFRQVGVQIDDIDGEELVFELDGWPRHAADRPVP